MKTIIIITCVAMLLSSCGHEAPVNEKTGFSAPIEQVNEPGHASMNAAQAHVLGYYVGEFVAVDYNQQKRNAVYKNKINISIDSILPGKIFGHSVVAGNSRPFSGTCEGVSQGFKVMAKEPGNDKYDGSFEFELDTVNERVKGTWVAYRSDLDVRKREYTLNFREFKYNPNDALPHDLNDLLDPDLAKLKDLEGESVEMITKDASKLNPSVVKLKKSDVENMYKGDLEVMRNSIYAKHGYSFKNRRMRFIFDADVDWYIPVTTDVRDVLTPLEKENIELIKRYEDHAEKYYDSFGR